jgi:hypothetical protein
MERGGILILPHAQFQLSEEERAFLIRVQHNVSFRPKESGAGAKLALGFVREEMRGFGDDIHRAMMRRILERYASYAKGMVEQLLTSYSGHLQPGFTAYRGEEEQGRKNAAAKRSDLLHINTFPDLPTRGGRILRVFTNLNDQRPRVWQVGEGFEQLAAQYGEAAGLKRADDDGTTLDRMAKGLRRFFPTYEIAIPRSPLERCSAYDRCMMRFHDWMEENSDFQKNAKKERIEFPPGASWLVFTDGVTHAVVSGKSALEQTLLVKHEALVAPDAAPVNILEKMYRKKLA